MKIGIFPLMAGRQGGGMETYERGLVQALAQLDDRNDYIIYALNSQIAEAINPKRPNFKIRIIRPAARMISMATTLPIAVARDGPDVFHATSFPPPLPPPHMVCTLHCLSQCQYPEMFPWAMRLRINALTKVAMRRARIIICSSEFTRRHAMEEFGLSRDQLPVIHIGLDDCFAPVDVTPELREELRVRYRIESPYFLFLGRFEARKNIIGLLRAFDLFRRLSGADHKLVLAGRQDWRPHGIDETIAALRLGRHVIRPGHLARPALPGLYSGADAFVMPSLWEGFGIPVIEAMACGTPAIVSNTSALPEVAGGAALLVDPESTEQIAEAMRAIAMDPGLRAELSAKGLVRARQFSWDYVAKQTIATYESACA